MFAGVVAVPGVVVSVPVPVAPPPTLGTLPTVVKPSRVTLVAAASAPAGTSNESERSRGDPDPDASAPPALPGPPPPPPYTKSYVSLPITSAPRASTLSVLVASAARRSSAGAPSGVSFSREDDAHPPSASAPGRTPRFPPNVTRRFLMSPPRGSDAGVGSAASETAGLSANATVAVGVGAAEASARCSSSSSSARRSSSSSSARRSSSSFRGRVAA